MSQNDLVLPHSGLSRLPRHESTADRSEIETELRKERTKKRTTPNMRKYQKNNWKGPKAKFSMLCLGTRDGGKAAEDQACDVKQLFDHFHWQNKRVRRW